MRAGSAGTVDASSAAPGECAGRRLRVGAQRSLTLILRNRKPPPFREILHALPTNARASASMRAASR